MPKAKDTRNIDFKNVYIVKPSAGQHIIYLDFLSSVLERRSFGNLNRYILEDIFSREWTAKSS